MNVSAAIRSGTIQLTALFLVASGLLLVLGLAGGRCLLSAFDEPRHRVVVGDESEPFVREGRNTFAKFVQRADPDIRPGDETLVVHETGDLLAVGRAELPGHGMADFETGMAVAVRQGADN